MDTVTQTVLGAAVGEAVLGRALGNRAWLWGGLLANFPDHDGIPGHFMSEVDRVDLHRSYSHSIPFLAVSSALFAALFRYKVYRQYLISFRKWTYYFFLLFLTHTLLDCFTSWGTQLLWPFSGYRFTTQSIFVVDPLYTIPLLICIVWIAFLHRSSKLRRRINYAGLCISTLYLLFTLVNKQSVNQVFEQNLQQQKISVERYHTHPTPFNNILWSFTGETKNGFYIGFYSWFDDASEVEFQFFDKKEHLIEPYRGDPQLEKLIDITNDFYIIRPTDSSFLFHSLRFGHPLGWLPENAQFVFTYELVPRGDERLNITKIKERVPTTDFNRALRLLWQRIKGKTTDIQSLAMRPALKKCS
jgi:inner membrane protein